MLLKMETLQLSVNMALERAPLACSRRSTSLPYVHAQMKNGDSEPVTAIAPGRRGCPLLLGDLDKKVQAYVRAVRHAGGSIGSSIVIAAAEGIVTVHDRTLLVQYGGHINLTRDWALSLLSRMRIQQ